MNAMKKHLLSAPALCMLAGLSTAQAETYTVPAPLLAPSSVSAESAKIPIPNGKEWDSFHGQLSEHRRHRAARAINTRQRREKTPRGDDQRNQRGDDQNISTRVTPGRCRG